jgi:Tol biopolymer transport system component
MTAKKTTALAVLLLVSVVAYILACSQATWSPDGKRIAFVSPPTDNGKGCSLIMWDGETGTTTVLLQADSPLSSPGWSPDGKMLAVVNYGVINPPQEAVAGSAVKAEVAADSAAKAETGAEAPIQLIGRLFLVNVEDGKTRLLAEAKVAIQPNSEGDACEPSPQWTEDGKMVAWVIPIARQVRVTDAKSGHLIKVVENALDPVISPSRKLMAMFTMSKGKKPAGVAIFDLEKMEQHSLITFGTPEFLLAPNEAMAWSPDSSRIILAGQPLKKAENPQPGEEQWVAGESSGLWTVAVSDGQVTAIVKDLPKEISSVNWALKGDRIAITTNPAKEGKDIGGKVGVWLLKTDGRDLRRIDSARTGDDMAFFPAFSPDGTRLCYQIGKNGISVVVYDLAAGAEKFIYNNYGDKLPGLDQAVPIEVPAESAAAVESAASATPATSAAPAK